MGKDVLARRQRSGRQRATRSAEDGGWMEASRATPKKQKALKQARESAELEET